MKEKYKIIREGLAVARFGCVMGHEVVSPGDKPIRFKVDEEEKTLEGEEFLVKPFRFLSAALTPYRYIDFREEGVLKTGVSLFDGLTVYANHNADVNQWKGYTQKPVWDEENEPNGINGLMVLDRTVDANLARGVEIGALRSASVTIWFEYKRSHPELRGFSDYLGEEVDGEIVRFIVTRLIRAGEVSVVWEGEDPYAKALVMGKSGKDFENLEDIIDQQGGKDMKFSKEFLNVLGISDANREVEVQVMEARVREEIGKLNTQIESLKLDAEIGKKHLEEIRDKASTLYKALKGDAAKENYIENVIKKADLETAQALVDEYQEGVEKAIPLTCPKCGEKLSRQSSASTGKSEDKGDKRVEDYKL
ncbi:MAG: hypothetical protein HY739_12965 [Desulfobacterales bacterium]|nr:hypothetical protein [Desulfobacterales bacterium]